LIRLGDDVRNAKGGTGEVEQVATEQTTQEMYNLTVDEAHTFYVGHGQWLVHNVCDLAAIARRYAENIATSAKTFNSRPSTIAVLETSDGQLFYGQSAHGESPVAELLNIIEEGGHPWNFGCAEVGCLNQVIKANPDLLQGSTITTIKIRGDLKFPTYDFHEPCPGGCSVLLKNLGVTIVKP
jgi:hypothetical protein